MGQVIASSRAAWPGTDPLEATRAMFGELGTPHLAAVPQLPARGPGSDPVGRTALFLDGLAADLQPHGWRVSSGASRDFSRARAALNLDQQILADVLGAQEKVQESLLLEFTGPVSLAASLYLNNGERALADHGARRDIMQALASGIGAHIAAVRVAAPDSQISVLLQEPLAAAAAQGNIATMSGYRTLRSLPTSEIRAAWTLMVEALAEAGVAQVALEASEDQDVQRLAREAGVNAFVLDVTRRPDRQWEPLAALIEAGLGIWASVVPVQPGTSRGTRGDSGPFGATPGPSDTSRGRRSPGAEAERNSPAREERNSAPLGARSTAALAQAIVQPWRSVGLSLAQLPALTVLPAGALHSLSSAQAVDALARSTALADALNQAMVS